MLEKRALRIALALSSTFVKASIDIFDCTPPKRERRWSDAREAHTLHPHPTLYTLHPSRTSYTLHPTPYTLNHTGCRAWGNGVGLVEHLCEGLDRHLRLERDKAVRYRGTSLMRNSPLLGPCSRKTPRSTSSTARQRIFIELMTSDRKLKASIEGSK